MQVELCRDFRTDSNFVRYIRRTLAHKCVAMREKFPLHSLTSWVAASFAHRTTDRQIKKLQPFQFEVVRCGRRPTSACCRQSDPCSTIHHGNYGRRFKDDVRAGIISDLLHQMYRNQDNERLQQGCMEVLEDLLEISYPLAQEIISFVDEQPDDSSLVRLGFGILKNFSGARLFHSSYEDFYDDFPSVIIDCMNRQKSDPLIQEYGILCMKAFIEEQHQYGFLDVPSITRVFLQAMRNHANNSAVHVEACNALYYLNMDMIISVEWPPTTMLQAMNNQAHCANAQISICTLLHEILWEFVDIVSDDAEVFLRLVSGQEYQATLREYVQATLQAMQNHSNNEKVQNTALCCWNLNMNLDPNMMIESNTSLIIQGGGVELVSQAIRLIGISWSGISNLEHLFKSSGNARKIAIEGDTIPTLLEHLRRCEICWRNHFWGDKYQKQDVQGATICTFSALNHLFLENDGNAVSLRIASEGGITPIVDVTVMVINDVEFELKDDGILAHLAMFPSAEGMLPLHYASCWHHFSNAEPQRARKCDFESQRLGHITVVEHLLKVYPEAATIRDGSGRLPLHAAIEANAPLPVLKALLHVNPAAGQAVSLRRENGTVNFPPALLAAVSNCNLESIFILLCSNPTITKTQSTTTIKRKRKSAST